ncbi:MAG: CheR family methyltransferase [Dyella sp.]|uniref:CheR family methyltransferase n=1 Tax=Dyella sp. TaxID=1869338 RepID=UPI003F81685F
MSSDPEESGQLVTSHLDFPVVGIGASAGGIAAVERLLQEFPKNPGMAFVVVLHLSPRHESQVDKILQRNVKMPVLQVRSPVPLEKNHVYVISPRQQLSMNDGYLRLTEAVRPRGRQVAIDFFFRTLAQVHRGHAVAAVLSGTGADGASGLARVREFGGVTFAQSPDDAEFDEMPRAAIATGAVDAVLPAPEMAERMLALASNARRIQLPANDGEITPAEAEAEQAVEQRAMVAVQEILAILRSHTGHDFRHYKRATILRRIERRMQVNNIDDLPGYRDFLDATPAERPALLQDLLISVTNFFRDREAFEALEKLVLPQVFLDKDSAATVRAWSAGCATGEEAYSLAILLSEEASKNRLMPGVQVFATDIDAAAIDQARVAVYSAAVTSDVPAPHVNRYFVKEGGEHLRVQKGVRERVLFAHHNILRDPPFSKLDLIACRNLLIYLNREVQRDVLEIFHFALRPGGFLFLGSSESADAAPGLFTAVDKKHRIYRANDVARSISRLGTSTSLGIEPRVLEQRSFATTKRSAKLADFHLQLMEHYAPPSILLGSDYAVLHMTQSASVYLRHVGGAPSVNLQTLILPELRLALRTTMFRATEEGRVAESQPTALVRDGNRYQVALSVRPVSMPEPEADLFLVVFHEVEDKAGAEPPHTSAGDPLVLQLEDELRRTREQLQMTVEQSETSGEELKASNEELQSINEELRSATEELETSKEELQSMNEELITVNHELKVKVEETSKVNDDLQNLIASTDIATVFIDRGMCIKRYTPRAADVFSIIPSDIGRSLMDITHRLVYEELLSDALETFQSLRTSEREVTTADGRWYIARMLPYRTTEDRIEGAVLTFIDITGRKRAEEEARKSEEHFRLVAESTDHAIITFNIDGVITHWNRAAERIFGYTAGEVNGLSGELLFAEKDRDDNAFARQLGVALSQGKAQVEQWYLRKDGTTVFCSGTTVPLIQGGPHGFAQIIRDVTADRRRNREQAHLLRVESASKEAAQQANLLKDEFLATMSHELKHPLNLMLMNAELLSMIPEIARHESARQAAAIIRRSILSQGQIIDDLLDLSRINTGKLTLKLDELDLAQSVRRLAGSTHDEATQRGLQFASQIPDTPVMVKADRVRIDQVIWNLLSNALKFTPAGGHIELQLSTTNTHAALVIADTGRGIAADQLEQVFEMFHQDSGVSTREGGGLGIGLALVRQLVELHGGTVCAQSPGRGQGARFTVSLPLSGARAHEEPDGIERAEEIDGLRIMVVDDAQDILSPFRQVLELKGAAVQTYDSAQAALEAFGAADFDVVLSDIGMPGMDGYQFIRELRALPGGDSVIALALTGFSRARDQREALDAGFDAHISKPVALKSLLAVLRRLRG